MASKTKTETFEMPKFDTGMMQNMLSDNVATVAKANRMIIDATQSMAGRHFDLMREIVDITEKSLTGKDFRDLPAAYVEGMKTVASRTQEAVKTEAETAIQVQKRLPA